jgi:hypothetical protein
MRRCAARYCPDDVLEVDADKGAQFCSLHWDLLPGEVKAWLASAYGTENWEHVLKAAIRALWRVESENRAQGSMPW